MRYSCGPFGLSRPRKLLSETRGDALGGSDFLGVALLAKLSEKIFLAQGFCSMEQAKQEIFRFA